MPKQQVKGSRTTTTPDKTGSTPRTATAGDPGNAARQDALDRAKAAIGGALSTAATLAPRLAGRGRGDIEREGTLTDPRSRKPVPLDRAFAEARAQRQEFGEWLMERYAFKPSTPTVAPNDNTLRIFSPGLNTPEPEASRRTAYYAEQIGQPMVHLHNGTNADAGIANAEMLDFAAAARTRAGIGSTPLLNSLVTILKTALSGADPQDVHAILYSDSTIAGSRAIGVVRRQLIETRVKGGKDTKAATAEVDALLERHLFVEMHGNVVEDLPRGPRYVLWSDVKDNITHGKMPVTGKDQGLSGVPGGRKDADARALHVDYDGPFGGADAHNLGAVGVHAVRQTWAANGVNSSQALYERNRGGAEVNVPSTVRGDASRLWNPRNDPSWGKGKK
jgi:hypothetical protein